MNTVVTSASPIMRAEAVWAVRSGFRTALAWARRPATRNSGATGRPSAAGHRYRDDGAEQCDPDEDAERTDAEQRHHGRRLLHEPQPGDDEDRAEGHDQRAGHAPPRARPPRGHEPLPHALDGWHRRGPAGGSQRGDERDPEPDDGRRRRASAARGAAPARAARSPRHRRSPGARWRSPGRSRSRPRRRASPTTSASPSTERVIWPRLAPSERSSASWRVR